MTTESSIDSSPDSEGENDVAPTDATRVDEEGDIAADYLEELLDIADIDGDIDIEVRDGRTYISIDSDEDEAESGLASLVGSDGSVLESLQELTRLAVLSSTGTRSRLVLDISGYRRDRGTQLREIAEDAMRRATETGASVSLEPMSAYERKIVHDAVAEQNLVSESEGEGPRRHIVISVQTD